MIAIFEDNQLVIGNDTRLKYIDIKYHFNKDKIAEGVIGLKYLPSGEQVADMLTKYTQKVIFERLRLILELCYFLSFVF